MTSTIEVVTRREVASVLATIAKEHGKVAADRARSALSAMFAWAVGDGLADINPVIGTNKHAGTTSRDRVLSDEELARIWLALDDDDYGRIVKLLILTGQRRDEIADLRRSEITETAIELPGERTKNHRPHVVPLSARRRRSSMSKLAATIRRHHLRFDASAASAASPRQRPSSMPSSPAWRLATTRHP